MEKYLFIFMIILLFTSCKEEEKILIHPEFQPYIDRFYDEAELRGVTLSQELEVVFSDMVPSVFCGYGYSRAPTHSALVQMRNSDYCWWDRTDIEKENIIFHELGHALLERPHINKSFPGGYTSTIMCTSEDDGPCSNYHVYYTNEMRSYFLDELFNSTTSPPAWTMNETYLRTVFSDTISEMESWEFYDTDDEANDYNFYIDEGNFNGSKSLAIEKSSNSAKQVHGYFIKRFSIESFPNCSSLKARALIKSESGFDGYVGIGISLREKDLNGDLYLFAYQGFQQTDSNTFLNSGLIETELFCIPEKAEVVAISITFQSSVKSTILIDDVIVELWN